MGSIDIIKSLSTAVIDKSQQHQEKKSWERRRIEPGAAGREASILPLCYAVPLPVCLCKPLSFFQNLKQRAEQKAATLRARELEKSLKAATQRQKEELKARQEANKKKREENARKTEVVQLVSSTFFSAIVLESSATLDALGWCLLA